MLQLFPFLFLISCFEDLAANAMIAHEKVRTFNYQIMLWHYPPYGDLAVLLYTCHTPAIHLPYTCYIPAIYLLYSCYIPAICLLYTSFIPAIFLLFMCLLLLFAPQYVGVRRRRGAAPLPTPPARPTHPTEPAARPRQRQRQRHAILPRQRRSLHARIS